MHGTHGSPNSRPFRSTVGSFQDTILPKIENAPNHPQNEMDDLTVKSTLNTLNTEA